jgi:hypothetical protein
VTFPHKLPQTLLVNTTGYFGFQSVREAATRIKLGKTALYEALR